jgi:hypothetical protein
MTRPESVCAFVTLEGDVDGTPKLESEIRDHSGCWYWQVRAILAHRLVGLDEDSPERSCGCFCSKSPRCEREARSLVCATHPMVRLQNPFASGQDDGSPAGLGHLKTSEGTR